MSAAADTPGIPFHPPIIHAVAFAAGWLLDRFVLALRLPDGTALVAAGALMALAGLALAGWAAWTMRRARTGIPVHHPVTALVTDGPFAWTRNPLYVSLNLLYAGAALVAGYAWPLLLLPAVALALQVLVIEKEERFLERRFPDDYPAYRSRVRRWL